MGITKRIRYKCISMLLLFFFWIVTASALEDDESLFLGTRSGSDCPRGGDYLLSTDYCFLRMPGTQHEDRYTFNGTEARFTQNIFRGLNETRPSDVFPDGFSFCIPRDVLPYQEKGIPIYLYNNIYKRLTLAATGSYYDVICESYDNACDGNFRWNSIELYKGPRDGKIRIDEEYMLLETFKDIKWAVIKNINLNHIVLEAKINVNNKDLGAKELTYNRGENSYTFETTGCLNNYTGKVSIKFKVPYCEDPTNTKTIYVTNVTDFEIYRLNAIHEPGYSIDNVPRPYRYNINFNVTGDKNGQETATIHGPIPSCKGNITEDTWIYCEQRLSRGDFIGNLTFKDGEYKTNRNYDIKFPIFITNVEVTNTIGNSKAVIITLFPDNEKEILPNTVSFKIDDSDEVICTKRSDSNTYGCPTVYINQNPTFCEIGSIYFRWTIPCGNLEVPKISGLGFEHTSGNGTMTYYIPEWGNTTFTATDVNNKGIFWNTITFDDNLCDNYTTCGDTFSRRYRLDKTPDFYLELNYYRYKYLGTSNPNIGRLYRLILNPNVHTQNSSTSEGIYWLIRDGGKLECLEGNYDKSKCITIGSNIPDISQDPSIIGRQFLGKSGGDVIIGPFLDEYTISEIEFRFGDKGTFGKKIFYLNESETFKCKTEASLGNNMYCTIDHALILKKAEVEGGNEDGNKKVGIECPMNNIFSVIARGYANNAPGIELNTYEMKTRFVCLKESIKIEHTVLEVREIGRSGTSPIIIYNVEKEETYNPKLLFIRCGSVQFEPDVNNNNKVVTDKCSVENDIYATIGFEGILGQQEYKSVNLTRIRSIELSRAEGIPNGVSNLIVVTKLTSNPQNFEEDEIVCEDQVTFSPLKNDDTDSGHHNSSICNNTVKDHENKSCEYTCKKIIYPVEWDGSYEVSSSKTLFQKKANPSSFQNILGYIDKVRYLIFTGDENTPIYLKSSDSINFTFKLNCKVDSFPSELKYTLYLVDGNDRDIMIKDEVLRVEPIKGEGSEGFDYVRMIPIQNYEHGMENKKDYRLVINNTLTAEKSKELIKVLIKVRDANFKESNIIKRPQNTGSPFLFISSAPANILSYLKEFKGSGYNLSNGKYSCENIKPCDDEYEKNNIQFFSDYNDTYLVIGGFFSLEFDEIKGFEVRAIADGSPIGTLSVPGDVDSYTWPEKYFYVDPNEKNVWILAAKISEIFNIGNLPPNLENKAITFNVVVTAKSGDRSDPFERDFFYAKQDPIKHLRLEVAQIEEVVNSDPDNPPDTSQCPNNVWIKVKYYPPKQLYGKYLIDKVNCLGSSDADDNLKPTNNEYTTRYSCCNSDRLDIVSRYRGYIGSFKTTSNDISPVKNIIRFGSERVGGDKGISYLTIYAALGGNSPPITKQTIKLWEENDDPSECNEQQDGIFKCTDFKVPMDWKGRLEFNVEMLWENSPETTSIKSMVVEQINQVLPPIEYVQINEWFKDPNELFYLNYDDPIKINFFFNKSYKTNVYPDVLNSTVIYRTPEKCGYEKGYYDCEYNDEEESEDFEIKTVAINEDSTGVSITINPNSLPSFVKRDPNIEDNEDDTILFEWRVHNILNGKDVVIKIKMSSLPPICKNKVYNQENLFNGIQIKGENNLDNNNNDDNASSCDNIEKDSVCMVFTPGYPQHFGIFGTNKKEEDNCNDLGRYKNETIEDYKQFFREGDISSNPNKMYQITVGHYEYNINEIKLYKLYFINGDEKKDITDVKLTQSDSVLGWELTYDIHGIIADIKNECFFEFYLETKSGLSITEELYIMREPQFDLYHRFSYILHEANNNNWITLTYNNTSSSNNIHEFVPYKGSCELDKPIGIVGEECGYPYFKNNDIQLSCKFGTEMNVTYGFAGLRGKSEKSSTDKTEIKNFDILDVLGTNVHSIQTILNCMDGYSTCYNNTEQRLLFVSDSECDNSTEGIEGCESNCIKPYPRELDRRSTICSVSSESSSGGKANCGKISVTYDWNYNVRLYTKHTVIEKPISGSKIDGTIPYITSVKIGDAISYGASSTDAIFKYATSGVDTYTVVFTLSQLTSQFVENIEVSFGDNNFEVLTVELSGVQSREATGTIEVSKLVGGEYIEFKNTKTYTKNDSNVGDNGILDKSSFKIMLKKITDGPIFCTDSDENVDCKPIIFRGSGFTSQDPLINKPIFKEDDVFSVIIGPIYYGDSQRGDVKVYVEPNGNGSNGTIPSSDKFYKVEAVPYEYEGGNDDTAEYLLLTLDKTMLNIKLDTYNKLYVEVYSIHGLKNNGNACFLIVSKDVKHKSLIIDRSKREMTNFTISHIPINFSGLEYPEPRIRYKCDESETEYSTITEEKFNLTCKKEELYLEMNFNNGDNTEQTITYRSTDVNSLHDFSYRQSENKLIVNGICNDGPNNNDPQNCVSSDAKVYFLRPDGGNINDNIGPDLGETFNVAGNTITASKLTMPYNWNGSLVLVDGDVYIIKKVEKFEVVEVVPYIKDVMINEWGGIEDKIIYLSSEDFIIDIILSLNTTSFVDKVRIDLMDENTEMVGQKLVDIDKFSELEEDVSMELILEDLLVPEDIDDIVRNYKLRIYNTPTYEPENDKAEYFETTIKYVPHNLVEAQYGKLETSLQHTEASYDQNPPTETKLFLKGEILNLLIKPFDFNPMPLDLIKVNIGNSEHFIYEEEFIQDVYPSEGNNNDDTTILDNKKVFFGIQLELDEEWLGAFNVDISIETANKQERNIGQTSFTILGFNKILYDNTYLDFREMRTNESIKLQISPFDYNECTINFEKIIERETSDVVLLDDNEYIVLGVDDIRKIENYDVFFKVIYNNGLDEASSGLYERILIGKLNNDLIGFDITVGSDDTFGQSLIIIPVYLDGTIRDETINEQYSTTYNIRDGDENKSCQLRDDGQSFICHGIRPDESWNGEVQVSVNGSTIIKSVVDEAQQCSLFPFISEISIEDETKEITINPNIKMYVKITLDKNNDGSITTIKYAYINELNHYDWGEEMLNLNNDNDNTNVNFITIEINPLSFFKDGQRSTTFGIQNFGPTRCRDLAFYSIRINKSDIICDRIFDEKENCLFLWYDTKENLRSLSMAKEISDNGINSRGRLDLGLYLSVYDKVSSITFTNRSRGKTCKGKISDNVGYQNNNSIFYGVFSIGNDNYCPEFIDLTDAVSDIVANIKLESGPERDFFLQVYNFSKAPELIEGVDYGFEDGERLTRILYTNKNEFTLNIKGIYMYTTFVDIKIVIEQEYSGTFTQTQPTEIFKETIPYSNNRRSFRIPEIDGEYRIIIIPYNRIVDYSEDIESAIKDLYVYYSQTKNIIMPNCEMMSLGDYGYIPIKEDNLSPQSLYILRVSNIIDSAGATGVKSIKIDANVNGRALDVSPNVFVPQEKRPAMQNNEEIFYLKGKSNENDNVLNVHLAMTNNLGFEKIDDKDFKMRKTNINLELTLPKKGNESYYITNDFNLDKVMIEGEIQDGYSYRYKLCDEDCNDVSGVVLSGNILNSRTNEVYYTTQDYRNIHGDSGDSQLGKFEISLKGLEDGHKYFLVVTVSSEDQTVVETKSFSVVYFDEQCSKRYPEDKWIVTEGGCSSCNTFTTPTNNRSGCDVAMDWQLFVLIGSLVVFTLLVVLVPILVVRWHKKHKLIKSRLQEGNIQESGRRSKSRSLSDDLEASPGPYPNHHQQCSRDKDLDHGNGIEKIRRYVDEYPNMSSASSSYFYNEDNMDGDLDTETIYQFPEDSHFRRGDGARCMSEMYTPAGARDIAQNGTNTYSATPPNLYSPSLPYSSSCYFNSENISNSELF